MNVPAVIRLLNEAIPLQLRSAAMYTWASGAATGIHFQAVATEFEHYGYDLYAAEAWSQAAERSRLTGIELPGK